jgi:choice-of-anchor B domain-containing protein
VRQRTRVAIGAVALTTVLVAVPAGAHDDDGAQYDDVMVQQSAEMEGAVASTAPDHSAAPSSFAPCDEGMAAGEFPCEGIDLLSRVDHDALGTTFVNDLWGWTDPTTGKDYALVGATEGTVFVDISDPRRPAVLGILPAHATDEDRPFWRDIKVHDDHAFIVSEQRGHGMQVFDLAQLRDWDGEYTTYEATAHYDGIDTAHNVAVNTDTGYAYVVGARDTDRSLNCGGGLHMVDVSEPASPSFAGCFADHGYIHDTECVVYDGPDASHQGRELCFSSNPDSSSGERINYVSIVDVTDKDAPVEVSRPTYPDAGYSHQGTLSPDQRYFVHGDELDELVHDIPTTTRVWDVSSLEEPVLVQSFANDTTSIDHNLYVEGRYAYASNYTSGLRVYDAGDLGGEGLTEVAYFDLYPENDAASFEGGTWSNYPFFRQKGIVAVSSMDRGLFVLQPRVERPGR